eukprot:829941-Amorphochlora_amoeboformis.AAC.2
MHMHARPGIYIAEVFPARKIHQWPDTLMHATLRTGPHRITSAFWALEGDVQTGFSEGYEVGRSLHSHNQHTRGLVPQVPRVSIPVDY